MADDLFARCTEMGFAPRHVVEVGVFTPDCSAIAPFLATGCRAELFEPHPDIFPAVKAAFAQYATVTVYPFAMAAVPGPIALYRRGASSFLATVPGAPATILDHYHPNDTDIVMVEGRTFDEFDDGTIDLLAVDTEGAEWFVLQRLKSRPQVISLEMRYGDYVNPFLQEIEAWLMENGYRAWYTCHADVVYRRIHSGEAAD